MDFNRRERRALVPEPMLDDADRRGAVLCERLPRDGRAGRHLHPRRGNRAAKRTRDRREDRLRPGRCRYVINAAGAHAYHVARLVGLELPIVPVRHEYFVTVPMADLTPDLPCFRVPELTLYGRVRDGGLLLGGWEPKSLYTDPRGYELQGEPPGVERTGRVEQLRESLEKLFPTARGAGKKMVGKGWPTFTPTGGSLSARAARERLRHGGRLQCPRHFRLRCIGKLLLESLLDPKPSPYVQSPVPIASPRSLSWKPPAPRPPGSTRPTMACRSRPYSPAVLPSTKQRA